MEKNRNLAGVNSAILFVVLLSAVFLTLGAWVQSRDFTVGILVTEFGIIMGGSMIYALLMREKWTSFFRLKKAKSSVYVKMFLISFFMLPIAAFLNGIAIVFIEYFGNFSAPDIPIGEGAADFALSIFVVAVSAGICEEFLFRGALMSSFERKLGRRASAILAAVLFGLFHFNLGNLFSPIALGIVFAYVTQVTGSIFPAMFGHFMNNANAVLISYLFRNEEVADSLSASASAPLIPELTTAQMLVLIVLVLAVVSVCVLAVRALLRSIRRSYPQRMSALYEEAVDERLDYLTGDYALWKKQPGRLGVLAIAGLIFYIAAYSFFTYLAFFSV